MIDRRPPVPGTRPPATATREQIKQMPYEWQKLYCSGDQYCPCPMCKPDKGESAADLGWALVTFIVTWAGAALWFWAMGRPLVGSVLVGLVLALITLVVILIINMPKKP